MLHSFLQIGLTTFLSYFSSTRQICVYSSNRVYYISSKVYQLAINFSVFALIELICYLLQSSQHKNRLLFSRKCGFVRNCIVQISKSFDIMLLKSANDFNKYIHYMCHSRNFPAILNSSDSEHCDNAAMHCSRTSCNLHKLFLCYCLTDLFCT